MGIADVMHSLRPDETDYVDTGSEFVQTSQTFKSCVVGTFELMELVCSHHPSPRRVWEAAYAAHSMTPFAWLPQDAVDADGCCDCRGWVTGSDLFCCAEVVSLRAI